MTRPRVSETDHGIQGEVTVGVYDQMQRRFRDKGWIETKDIIESGMTRGLALEIGSGPGYLGLEWLKQTDETILKGLDISPDMIAVAERNAEAYGLTDRAEYIQSSGEKIPFDDETFDAVFTNGSLHEWSDPTNTFNEMRRVLKRGGRLFVSDLRRDMFFLVKWFVWFVAKPKEIRPGLITSINAAYTPGEIENLLSETRFQNYDVTSDLMGVKIHATR
jgi:ubiquinone/menaquinone biosynthesis C-methylase UbiE